MSQGGRDADGYVVQPVGVRDLTLRSSIRMALRWMQDGAGAESRKMVGGRIRRRALGKDSAVV